jgi:hypothetical protein
MSGTYRTADATVSAHRAAVVTFSDSGLIENTRALYIGASGNLAVRMTSGATVTFQGLSAGTILPVQVNRVLSTGTTVGAGTVLALY